MHINAASRSLNINHTISIKGVTSSHISYCIDDLKPENDYIVELYHPNQYRVYHNQTQFEYANKILLNKQPTNFGGASVVFQGQDPVVYTINEIRHADDYIIMIDSSTYQTQYFDHQYDETKTRRINTGDGIIDQDINFTLSSGAAICGSIFDNDQPASNVIVSACH